MRPVRILRPVLLAAVLLTLGCSSDNKGKIEGQWSSVPTTAKGINLPAGALQLTFGADGSLAYKAGPKTFTGRYSLGWRDQVTFNLDLELGGHKTHMEQVSVSGNQLTLTDSDGTQVVFTKAN